MLLADKIIFLTGGSSGIGYECAKAYAREGAKLAIIALDKGEIDDVIREIGPEHLGIPGDVGDAVFVERAICETLDKFGRIDAIHNNAGISSPSKMLHLTSEEEFDQLMRVNVKGIYHTTKYGFSSLVQSAGCILNTSSVVGEIGQELHAAYTATKGAVNALTRSMALDYARHKIRVNAVSPAAVWTPMLEQWNNEQPEAMKEKIRKYLDDIHPIGFCPEGDVIADACVFLLSDLSRFITGCVLPVSGGAELGYKKQIVLD